MFSRLKKLVVKIVAIAVLAVIVLGCWFVAAKLYPDEWWTEIPRLILDLLGFDVE